MGPRNRQGSLSAIAVPVGETIELNIPAVCLNYGWPTPTGRDKFTLMTVEEYTTNSRIRKALRSLATYGTSLGVAQSVMWRVCNDLSFEAMVEQGGKVMNSHEVALAARLSGARRVDRRATWSTPPQLSTGRIFVQVHGEGISIPRPGGWRVSSTACVYSELPLQIAESEETSDRCRPGDDAQRDFDQCQAGETRGAIVASTCSVDGAWLPLGKVAFRDNSSSQRPRRHHLVESHRPCRCRGLRDGEAGPPDAGFDDTQGRKPAPLHGDNLVVRAGTSSGAPPVAFEGVGVGPARSVLLPIQAATASLVERVEINGL